MAGVLDFILAQQGRRDRERLRTEQQQTIRSALGRAPGVGPFKPGQGGAGLLADPTDPTNQARFAGQLAAVAPQQGAPLLSGIFGDVQSGQNVEAQQTGANVRQELANEQADINSRRGAETALRQSEIAAQVSRLNSLDRLDATLAGQQGGFGIPGVDLGPVSPGMARVINPETGTPIDVALPGSAPHIKARDQLNAQQTAVDNLDLFMDLFDKTGTEFASPDAQTLQTYRQRVISAVAVLDNMGVLQAGELERIESSLADPTAFGRQVQSVVGGLPVVRAATGSNASIRAGYQALRDQFDDQHARSLETFKFWPGLESFQPAPVPEGFE